MSLNRPKKQVFGNYISFLWWITTLLDISKAFIFMSVTGCIQFWGLSQTVPSAQNLVQAINQNQLAIVNLPSLSLSLLCFYFSPRRGCPMVLKEKKRLPIFILIFSIQIQINFIITQSKLFFLLTQF